jgi:kynurenine formamidase
MDRHRQRPDDAHLSADEFDTLFQDMKRWGRWGTQDQRGALHFLTPQRVAASARLVRDGVSVSLSLPLNTEAAIDNPKPAVHRMILPDVIASGEANSGLESPQFVKDYIGVDYHNDGHTHIDALCHVDYQRLLYNAQPDDSVTTDGASVDTIDILKDGLVGRGVLLDIPRLRGVPWLEPGEHIFRDDLEAAERAQGLVVGEGDILLIRTGHVRRLSELGPWDTAQHKAGLHPTAMSFIAERLVAALGSDGNSDTAPSTTDGVGFPIHVLAINALGIHLLDYLQLEDLRAACEQAGRWEFLFVAAPLRIPGGTGSPVNPLAIL